LSPALVIIAILWFQLQATAVGRDDQAKLVSFVANNDPANNVQCPQGLIDQARVCVSTKLGDTPIGTYANGAYTRGAVYPQFVDWGECAWSDKSGTAPGAALTFYAPADGWWVPGLVRLFYIPSEGLLPFPERNYASWVLRMEPFNAVPGGSSLHFLYKHTEGARVNGVASNDAQGKDKFQYLGSFSAGTWYDVFVPTDGWDLTNLRQLNFGLEGSGMVCISKLAFTQDRESRQ
jgi:hypothetical protein